MAKVNLAIAPIVRDNLSCRSDQVVQQRVAATSNCRPYRSPGIDIRCMEQPIAANRPDQALDFARE